MTSIKRVWLIIISVIMLVCAVVLVLSPELGYIIIILILDVSLLLYGIRLFVYYITMARHMVDGINTLYKSLVLLDFGVFVFTMKSTPEIVIMLYLIGCMAFQGLVEMLEAGSAMKLKSGRWKYGFISGAVKIAIAVACMFFLKSIRVLSLLYAVGLVQSAVENIVTACRKTAVVYIE